jgi:chitin-binding protein
MTKPDQLANSGAGNPECRDAFALDFDAGYRFMSVLTHARGRAAVSPLPPHVCGFGSETWQGRATIWDAPINWPTNPMQAGRQKFAWNISWGPHFDDTEEFRYWITKPGFQYKVGTPLTWADFEDQAFCSLKYDDKNPGNSPDVVADKAKSMFNTYCTVPQRSGRHVIYGEWGRNQFTLERFHSCVDVNFAGTQVSTETSPVANIAVLPNVTQINGSGSLSLSAGASTGSNLSYQWSVSAPNAGLYTLSNATTANASLQFANPASASNVVVTLLVRNSKGTNSATRQFNHSPFAGAVWTDLGSISNTSRTLNAGDTVRLRIVRGTGQDQYFPPSPLVLTAANATANAWPLALANAVNASTGSDLRVGVLSNGVVTPAANATSNRVYALPASNVTGAFVEVTSSPVVASGNCTARLRTGSGPYWAGLDIASNDAVFTLDFTATGLDLSRVRVDGGNFTATVTGQKVTLRKPAWVTLTNPGYFGLSADNYAPLANFQVPVCSK